LRRFTIVQEIATDVDGHWRLFLDDEYDRSQCLEGFRYPRYEILESRTTDDEVVRRIAITPRLDVPAAVAKILGPRFAFREDSRFDRRAKVWRSRLVPDALADRLSSDAVVRAAPAGDGRCRRTCEISIDARIFAVGGLVEAALESELRRGWVDAAAFMNAWLRRATISNTGAPS
jgi:hypothetical protein